MINSFKHIKLSILIIILLNFNLFAHNLNENFNDTLKSKVIRYPSIVHGRTILLIDSIMEFISKKDIQDINYSGLSDIINHKENVISLHSGVVGNYNTFSYLGANPKNNSFQFNSRNINNQIFGSINPEVISTEFFERIEILKGSNAVIFGNNSNGVLFNVQEIVYNTAKPFSRLWFIDGGNELIGADGIYSQNFYPEWNFTFGFKNINSNGYLSDMWTNLWNVRSILRYNNTDYSSISLVYNFFNSGFGNGGGVNHNLSNDVFNNIQSQSFFHGNDEREFNHSFTITYSNTFDSTQNIAIQSSLFFTNSLFDRKFSDNIIYSKLDTINQIPSFRNKFFGGNFSFEKKLDNLYFFKLGAEINYNFIQKNYLTEENEFFNYSLFNYNQIIFNDYITLSGGLRYTFKNNINSLSFGSKIKINVNNYINSSVDISFSEYIPELFELKDETKEKNFLVLAFFNIVLNDKTYLKMESYYRKIKDYRNLRLIYDNEILNDYYIEIIDELNNYGGEVNFESQLFNFINYTLSLKLNFSDSQIKTKFLPEISFYSNIFYQYKPSKNILRIGIESNFASGFEGYRFIPFFRSFIISDYRIGSNLQYLTPYLYLRISNASVRASFENVLNSNYYNIAIYPGLRRNFRLSFNWTFLED